MYTENLSKETSQDRALGIFLEEIASVRSKAIIKCLPLVIEFLEAEVS